MKLVQLAKRFARNCTQVRIIAPLLITLLWSASTFYLPANPISAAFSLIFLSTVPGYVLYRTIAGYPRDEPKTRTVAYSVGLSLVALILLGLGINELYQRFLGQLHPLNVTNMTPVIAGFTAIFTLTTAFRFRQQHLEQLTRYFRWATWRHRTHLFWYSVSLGIILLLMPLLAIAGANTLNNGGPNWLALMALGLVAVVMLGMAWTRKLHLQKLYPLALYSMALTLLLGTSMRGWEITGHDIMQEFQVFQLTSLNSLWNMNFYQDAYTACLSITILPTILQKLSGMYDPYIFKLVFQFFFALIVPLLYAGLRTYVPRKTAFLAALVFMTFPTFLTDMMMLNRQEVAMLFFGLSVFVMLDTYLPKPVRHMLAIIFLGGMVLSHYSTSYITASVMIVMTGLGVGVWLLRPLLRKFKLRLALAQGPHFTVFPPYIVGLVLLMVVGWSTLATHTAGNISQTITGIGNEIVRLVNPQAVPPKPIGEVVDKELSAFERYQSYINQTRPLPLEEYYSPTILKDAQPTEQQMANAKVSIVAKALGLSGDKLSAFYNLIRQGYVAVLAGFLALGLGVMLLKRRATRLPNQYMVLGAAYVAVVVLQVVLPSDAVNYGLARVIQQALVVLALPVAVGMMWLLGKARFKFGTRFRLAGVVLAMFFLVLSSLLSTITGGFRPALALSNSGFYYEAYYTHPEEIRAMQWLAANAPKGSRVYADEFSRRKMITYAGIFSQPTLLPQAIPVDSYVFLSKGNTTFGEVPAYYQGELFFYSVPTTFLKANKSLVYNSGGVQIYK